MCINKNEELLPYYELAKSKLNYDPITGDFTWKFRAGSTKNGKAAGTINSKGYRKISQVIDKKKYQLRAHRLAWFITHNELPKQQIDHIDEDKLNNAISNLRSCTQSQNKMNQGKYANNTSGFKGVSWHRKGQKWMASVRINGKNKHLGLFTTAESASAVYEAKAKEGFGKFYNTNKNIKE